jgi:drug/metabolite transporter (DMT)-like permease
LSDRGRAILLLLLSAVLWSTGGVLIKWVDWNPLAISGVRSLISAAVLALYLRKPRWRWSRDEVFAAVAYAVTVLLFVAATKYTTAANAIFLQYTTPIYVALLGAWLLGEKATWRDWLAIAVILAGMALFFLDGLQTGHWLGDGIAILSGMTMGTMIVLLRKVRNESPMQAVFLGNMIAACIGLPFAIGASVTASNVMGIVLLGVFQLGIPYLLYSFAIRHVTALEASIIPAIEPVLNPLWVLLILGEAPRPLALVGGAIVVGAAVGRSLISSGLTRRTI